MAPATRLGAMALMIASAACWGLGTVATKGVLDDITPFRLLAIQLSASVATLWLLATLCGAQPRRADLREGWAGVFEPGLAYGVGVPGLALTGAASASVIGAAEPVFILAIAWCLLGHRPTQVMFGALSAATAGVLLVVLPGATGGPRLAGDALVMLGTLFAAIYVVLSHRAVGRLDPLPLATLQQSVGLLVALVLLALAWATGWERGPAPLAPATLLAAMASGMVQYALAFWCYLQGLRRLSPGEAGTFLTLIPVFGVGGAALLLGEPILPVQIIGTATVLGALLVLARARPAAA